MPTGSRTLALPKDVRPTVGMLTSGVRSYTTETHDEPSPTVELIQALQQITGGPIDQEAVEHMIKNCRSAAIDCTIEEIIEFAWSKAFLCRSGKIENPVGFLITQVPKHFQREALQAYRVKKRRELESAAEVTARDEERRQQLERELAEQNERQRVRTEIAERHRKEQGIDLKCVLRDSEADDALKVWAKRMLSLGHQHQARYD